MKKSFVLTDVDTAEVSLVDRGANRKRIALRKQEKNMKITAEVKKAALLLSVLKTMNVGVSTKSLASDRMVDLKKDLGAMKPEARKKVLDAIKLLASMGGELPDGILNDFVEALGIESASDLLAAMEAPDAGSASVAADTVPEGTTTPEEEIMDAAKSDATTKALIATVTAASKVEIEKANKIAADANARAEALEKGLKVEKDARLTATWLTKANTMSGVIGVVKADALAALLKKLDDVAPELTKELVEKVLDPANVKMAQIDQLLKEVGRSPKGENTGDTADAQLTQKAAEIRKSNPKLTEAAAYAQATLENPALYEQSEAEQRERARRA